MVCVTQQKTCDRLIQYGREFLGNEDGELSIIHVAHYQFKFLGNTKEGEALDYLYEKALEYGASLTVVRSNHILDTLIDQVKKEHVDYVVIGESRESDEESTIPALLSRRLEGRAKLLIIPA
jgi:K+-sensing histidine kinase KdpD